MTENESKNLKQRIDEEMIVDHGDIIERNFDRAKKFIGVTREGKVSVLIKDKLTGQEQILLYLIGKHYAAEAGYAESVEVGNEELVNELGVPIGSVLPWLKWLREGHKIEKVRKEKYVYHSIPLRLVEKTLEEIERKLSKIAGGN
jgi:hypothetical protein